MYRNGNVFPVPNYALRYEDVWWSGGIILPFLTSALEGREWSASRPGHYTPGKGARGTHWRRSRRCGVEKSLLYIPGIEPRSPSL
jgi:hypothetical protein